MPLLYCKWNLFILFQMYSNGQTVDLIIPIQTVSQQEEMYATYMKKRQEIMERRTRYFGKWNGETKTFTNEKYV